MLRTPVIAPFNMVSMIHLESCVLQTPTCFFTAVMCSATNSFEVCNAAGTFQYSLWKNIYDADHTVQSNTQSMNTLLKKCVNIDTTNTNNQARFFCDIYKLYATVKNYFREHFVSLSRQNYSFLDSVWCTYKWELCVWVHW